MTEEWRDVEGYESLYQVSNLGRVKSLERVVMNNGGLQHKYEKILKFNVSRGYHIVHLSKEGKVKAFTVHRLVAIAFIPNEDNKPNVDHIDTNPSNNHVDNLRWVTQHENAMNPLTRINNSESKKGHPCYLREHTEETKKKISDVLKGKKLSEEHKQKISDAHKGKTFSAEHLKKLSDAKKGHEVSEDTRDKIRQKLIGVHKDKKWKVEGGKRVWY